jgi:hypothetical protein
VLLFSLLVFKYKKKSEKIHPKKKPHIQKNEKNDDEIRQERVFGV